MGARFWIGTSGWHYAHWQGLFYPEGMPTSRWLAHYIQHFPTVEINNSFYRQPKTSAWQLWRRSVPDGFRFAVKVNRFITHIKRLKDVAEPVTTFLSRAGHLKEKLGPLLYQLPPNMRRNDERLEAFLSLLPKEHRHVVEFRHESWLDEGVFDILRRHHVGFCVFDMPGLAGPLVATADFAYIRLHGATGLYCSCYSDAELEGWAKRIAGLARDLEAVYIYFNNDAEGFAVQNAHTLWEKLTQGSYR